MKTLSPPITALRSRPDPFSFSGFSVPLRSEEYVQPFPSGFHLCHSFPGQGSQFCMARDLFENETVARHV